MLRPLVATLVSLASVASLAAGQTPLQTAPTGQTAQPGQVPAPTRTPPRALRPGEPPPKGTAVIRGRVVGSNTGAPIRRAQIRATSMEARGGGVTNTNADGFYEIKELPAGRYSIFATKGGYVSLQYGQRRPGEQGTPLELSDGQQADKVNFSMPRGGVIAGQITDDSGDPVSGTAVSAMRFAFMGGTRRLMPAGAEGGNDRTDDQGNFRLYGLPPGEYILSATNRLGGVVLQAEINNTETEGYAPTYYPGTANVTEAVRVNVRAGQQHLGTNFSLIVAKLARVRGRALNSRGEPVARAMIMMTPADSTIMAFSMGTNSAMASPDGGFQIPNVAPGRYLLSVRPFGQSGPGDEFANLPITVGSDDIDDVLVTTSPGSIARGMIVADDGTAPSFRHDAVQVSAMPAEPLMAMPAGNTSGRVNEDFTFEITSVFDRRIVRAFVPANTGWYVKAVYHGGVDVSDTGVDFGSRRVVDDLQIVVTRKTTELSGLVLDARGKPVLDATVTVFPANRERWKYFSNRFLRTTRPDTEGLYRMRAVPPDEPYLIIAVQGLQEGQASDPEFLARARLEAKPLALAEGEPKTVDVTLSTLQP